MSASTLRPRFRPGLAAGFVVALAAVGLLAAGCEDEADGSPYLRFAGGGFIFNYNRAEAYYGFVAERLRGLPKGSVIEAEFENPAGGAPFTEVRAVRPEDLEFTFRTPSLDGVQKDVPYRVELRLRNGVSGDVIARYERTFSSSLDQSDLPEVPLTVGPGYQPNPASPYAQPR